MSTDRPKRNIIKKKYDDSEGMPWCEERVVRKVLFLSLREFRSGQRNINTPAAPGGSSAKRHGRRSAAKGGLTVNGRTDHSQHGSRETSEDNSDRKRPRLKAQRKFAQSQPSSPSSAPLKTTPPDPVSDAPSNHRPPKTEDFLSYLCLRGTVALPGNMAHLGSVQDDADLHGEEEEEAGPEGGTAANQGKNMSNCTVFPSHGRCLRGRPLGTTRGPGETAQGVERRERLLASTTTTPDPSGPSARASAPNQLRYRYPRAPQQLSLVPTATGLSGILSSARRAARTQQTPPLRLLPPRAARSSAPPPRSSAPPARPAAPPSRSSAPPARSSAPPIRPAAPPPRPAAPPPRSPAGPSRTAAPTSRPTSRPKIRRVKTAALSFRRRRSNSRRPKPHRRRANQRLNPRRPKRNPRPASHAAAARHRRRPAAHATSGKIPNGATAKPSKPAAAPSRGARAAPRSSAGSLRQSRRRRGLPAETDAAAPEVMEVRLQVSGPQTRSRTLGHAGKVGRGAAAAGRHVGKVPSKPAPGQRPAQQPVQEAAAPTRQAQSSQG